MRRVQTSHRFFQWILNHFANDLGGFSICLEQLLTLLAVFLNAVVLIEELFEEGLLVELCHETVLHDVLAVVYEKMHNCFGDLISD